MSKHALFAVILLCAIQEDPVSRARSLVEKLRSESIEDREVARKALIELGKAALPALREAARDSDAQVAKTASVLILRLEFLEKLSPRLRKWIPGVETRLAQGGDRECMTLLLESTQYGSKNPMPLTRIDVDPLAGPALRGAVSDDEFKNVIEAIGRLRLKGAESELRTLVRDHPARAPWAASTLNSLGFRLSPADFAHLLKGDYQAQWTAVHILESIGGPEAKKAIQELEPDRKSGTVMAKAAFVLYRWGDSQPLLKLLDGASGDAEWEALDCIQNGRVREAIPALVKILDAKPEAPRRARVLQVLSTLRAEEAIPTAVRFLGDRDIHVRDAAAGLLFRVGSPKESRHVERLLKDSYIPVQLTGMKAAAAWNVRSTLPTLRSLVSHKHISLQMGAIEALGALKAREAAEDLLPLLTLKDPSEVKRAAVKALGAMGAREAVPAIAGVMIDDWSWSVPRNEVWEVLRELNAREQIAGITERLKDPSPFVRWSILIVLSEFGWNEAAPEVAKRLRDEDSKVQLQAIWTLGQLKAIEYSGDLEKVIAEGDEKTLWTAFATLCRLDPKRAEPYMRRFLVHENLQIRNGAIVALAIRGDPQGIAALEKLAADPGDYWSNVRDAAFQVPVEVRDRILKKLPANPNRQGYVDPALLKHADQKTLSLLEAQLEDKNPDSRSRAASLVLATGDVKYIAKVRPLLEDPVPGVRAAALSALAGRKVREIIPDVRERLFDIDPNVRVGAMGAVQSLDLTEAVPDLEELLSDSHDWLQMRAIQVLGHLKSRVSVPRLKAFLANPDPYRHGYRSAALTALGSIGDRSVTADVAAMLDDPTPSVRADAARVLVRLGAGDHVEAIEALLRDPEPDVRSTALELIVQLKKARAIPLIQPLLEDPSTYVRDGAALALVRLGSAAGVPRILQRTDYNTWIPVNALNGVRRPEIYARLGDARITKAIRGSLKEVVEAQLGPLGLSLDASSVPTDELKKHSETQITFDPNTGNYTTLSILESHVAYPFEFILEPNSVRLVTCEQARTFWKAWWAERQTKK
jgi:HEAT repeat protein